MRTHASRHYFCVLAAYGVHPTSQAFCTKLSWQYVKRLPVEEMIWCTPSSAFARTMQAIVKGQSCLLSARHGAMQATVAYYLMQDNRRRMPSSAYLRAELSEASDAAHSYPSGALPRPDSASGSRFCADACLCTAVYAYILGEGGLQTIAEGLVGVATQNFNCLPILTPARICAGTCNCGGFTSRTQMLRSEVCTQA